MRYLAALALIIVSVPVTLATAGTPTTLIVPVMLFVAWRLISKEG